MSVAPLLLLGVALSLLIAGCGSTSAPARNNDTSALRATAPGPKSRNAPRLPAGTAIPRLPRPTNNTAASRAALRAGFSACRHATPAQIRRAFLEKVRHAGGSGRELRFLRATARSLKARPQPPPVERRGPLAALMAAHLYALTLPTSARPDGFAGCAYELRDAARSR